MSESYILKPFDGLDWKAVYELADKAIPFDLLSSRELWQTVGQMLYEQLMDDLQGLGAEVVWMREYFNDDPLLSFVKACGFVEAMTIWDMRAPANIKSESMAGFGLQLVRQGEEQQLLVPVSALEPIAQAERLGFRRVFGYITLEKPLR